MDGVQQDRVGGLTQKVRRTGLFLTLLVAGLFVYSFVVIKYRGRLPEPANLTPLQKLLRGL